MQTITALLDASGMAHCMVPLHDKASRFPICVHVFLKTDYLGPGSNGELQSLENFQLVAVDTKTDLVFKIAEIALKSPKESRSSIRFLLIGHGRMWADLAGTLSSLGFSTTLLQTTDAFFAEMKNF